MDEATRTDGTWRPDVLGGDWVARDLDLPDGAVATLVRRDAAAPAGDRPAVLYVHGFIDYFFQTHVAEAVEARGYRFYAVDLRGYGRSIGRGSGAPSRPDGGPNFVTDLAGDAQGLDAAARAHEPRASGEGFGKGLLAP